MPPKTPNKNIGAELRRLQVRLEEAEGRLRESGMKAEDLEASIQRAYELQEQLKKAPRRSARRGNNA